MICWPLVIREDVVAWMITVILATTSVSVVAQESHSSPAFNSKARRKMICGPNCVYVLCRLYGREVPEAFLELPVDSKGMSLLEVRDSCATAGLPSYIRACSPTEFARDLEGPAIIYLKNEANYPAGHFVIAIPESKTRIRLLDATTARLTDVSVAHLDKFWGGYAVIPRTQGIWWLALVFAYIVAIFFWAWALRSLIGRHRLPNAQKADR